MFARRILIFILFACAILQPASSTVIVDLENGDRKANNLWRGVGLSADQIIKGTENASLRDNVWFKSKFFINSIMHPEPDHAVSSVTIGARTSASEYREPAWVVTAINDNGQSDNIDPFNKRGLNNVEPVKFYESIITDRISLSIADEKSANFTYESVFHLIYNLLKWDPWLNCISDNVQYIKWSYRFLYQSCFNPNQIIGDVNFTGGSGDSPLRCTNLGVCGHHD